CRDGDPDLLGRGCAVGVAASTRLERRRARRRRLHAGDRYRLDARRAANAGDVEAFRRKRGHERTKRIALAVEVARVDKAEVAGQTMHVSEELGHRDGEAEVDE